MFVKTEIPSVIYRSAHLFIMDNIKNSKLVKGDFQKIVDHIKTISDEAGEPVNSETDLTARCESLKYLNDLRYIAESISQNLASLCEKEKKEIQIFIEKQEQRLASVKNALRDDAIHVPLDVLDSEASSSPPPNADNMFVVPEILNPGTGAMPQESREEKSDNPWELVGKKGRTHLLQYQEIIPPAQSAAVKTNGATSSNGYTIISHQVGKNGGFVRAVEVDAIDDCVRFPGKICWSKSKHVLCFSFDGVARPLVNKIPKIYSVNETPQKFYHHKYLRKGETVNPEDHTYYIPIENTEFADHWCFTDRARYLPASIMPSKADSFIYRIGDYDNFTDDLSKLREDSPEYLLFRNIASGYWIALCAIENEFKRRRRAGRK